jgi:transposase
VRLAARQKKAHRQGAVIVFWDETGFLMLPTVQRTWGIRGQTPFLWHQLKHQRRISAIGMISISPHRRRLGCYHFLWPHDAIDDAVVVAVLRQLRRHFRRPIILLWDRLQAHRSGFVQAYLARTPDLDIEYFPAYAPELNPVEALWSDTKQHDLAQFCPHDLEELEHATEQALDHKIHDQHRIAGYIHQAELPIQLYS